MTERADAAVEGLVDDLAEADAAYRERVADVADIGEPTVEQTAEAYRDIRALFDEYEEEATGDGDFQRFIEFQGQLETFVEGLPADLRAREAFEDVDDLLQQRRLSESDFEKARDALEPAARMHRLLVAREEALEAYRDARHAVLAERRDVDERIDDLERLTRLGDADLDAPTERLRDPIESYNDDVRAAFREFKRDAPAREVLTVVDRLGAFPLVPFETPDPELLSYVREAPPGGESVAQLLEYADYSESKLDHYVDEPARLRRVVGGNRLSLERLSGDPATVEWPPPPADVLRHRAGELVAAVARFAPDPVVAEARALRALPAELDYERLRESAVAADELGPEERERLAAGGVADDLAAARRTRERLTEALEEYPER
jgi:hypothetical protein